MLNPMRRGTQSLLLLPFIGFLACQGLSATSSEAGKKDSKDSVGENNATLAKNRLQSNSKASMNMKDEPKIRVPYSNVQVCHDDLRRDALSLWTWFENRLVPAANTSNTYGQRLDAVLLLKEKAWEEYLTEQKGNPRVAEGPWNCAVGDLVLALSKQAIDSVVASTQAAGKHDQLQDIEKLVTQKLSWSSQVPLLKNLLRVAESQIH